MTLDEKLEFIVNWYAKHQAEPVGKLSKTGRMPAFNRIEGLSGRRLPRWYNQLYSKYDGEIGKGLGSFMSDFYLSVDDAIKSLEFSVSLIKPEVRRIENVSLSDRLTEQMVAVIRLSIPDSVEWHKVIFDTGVGTMGGPYIYYTPLTTDRDRKYLELEWSAQRKILDVTKELQSLEQKSYNWDKLAFEVYRDKFRLQRLDDDLSSQLSCYPEGTIRLKYFHRGWIPIFGDMGGNYIGVDLDPDEKGTEGQVIIFGRDEDRMIVLANSFEEFLDMTISTIKKDERIFLTSDHLHEVYRTLVASR